MGIGLHANYRIFVGISWSENDSNGNPFHSFRVTHSKIQFLLVWSKVACVATSNISTQKIAFRSETWWNMFHAVEIRSSVTWLKGHSNENSTEKKNRQSYQFAADFIGPPCRRYIYLFLFLSFTSDEKVFNSWKTMNWLFLMSTEKWKKKVLTTVYFLFSL